MDPKSEVASQYGVRGIPMSFLINPQGKVVAFAGGYIKWDSKINRRTLEKFLSKTI